MHMVTVVPGQGGQFSPVLRLTTPAHTKHLLLPAPLGPVSSQHRAGWTSPALAGRATALRADLPTLLAGTPLGGRPGRRCQR